MAFGSILLLALLRCYLYKRNFYKRTEASYVYHLHLYVLTYIV